MAAPIEDRLRSALSKAHIGQRAAAVCIGVSRTIVGMWLTGGAPVSARHREAVNAFVDDVEDALRSGHLPDPTSRRLMGTAELKKRLARR